jgi:undecaprenyl-diphosphatase
VSLYVAAIILGLVEGITEFLPISSTGHLILAGHLLHFTGDKAKVFEIVIQTGAMFAVVWEYRARFGSLARGLVGDPAALRFVALLGIAFTPAAVIGLLAGDAIKEHLFNPITVAIALVTGGVVMLWAERRDHKVVVHHVDDITWRKALQIGCAQCLALIPGTSRAAATIIGGLVFGLSRRAATEFSFFLAVPTLLAAGAYDLVKQRHLLSSADVGWFALGMLVAFVSALACVRWLIRYISSHDFGVFAVYRIVFGLIILITAYTGIVSWSGMDR